MLGARHSDVFDSFLQEGKAAFLAQCAGAVKGAPRVFSAAAEPRPVEGQKPLLTFSILLLSDLREFWATQEISSRFPMGNGRLYPVFLKYVRHL